MLSYRTFFRAVPLDSLVFFRIAFGLVMLWEVWRYFRYDWIARYWIRPDFNFRYSLFEWVHPLPGEGMYWVFYVLGFLSICIALGFAYRFSTVIFFIVFSYTFLLEEARYLNHFYLLILLSFLFIFIPAHRHFSLDALFRPKLRSSTTPLWALWLVRFQIAVPYFFGGIAKLNSDWLQAEPMRSWLSRRTDFPLLGRFFREEWAVYLFSHGGLGLDLLAVPLMLFRKTRLLSFALLVVFHLLNAKLFSIGIFPFMMIAATTLFFPASWPRDLWDSFKAKPVRLLLGAGVGLVLAYAATSSFEPIPLLITAFAGALIARGTMPTELVPQGQAGFPARATLILSLLALWGITQIALPLRHYLIPSQVSWSEEGHRFAWHMKLRSKQGDVTFEVFDPKTGHRLESDFKNLLTSWQYSKMAGNPHMIQQFARYLASMFEAKGLDVEVRARAYVSLNGREKQLLIDPEVNLLAVSPVALKASWILPLHTALERYGASDE